MDKDIEEALKKYRQENKNPITEKIVDNVVNMSADLGTSYYIMYKKNEEFANIFLSGVISSIILVASQTTDKAIYNLDILYKHIKKGIIDTDNLIIKK